MFTRRLSIVGLCLASLCGVPALAAPLVTNGGFETETSVAGTVPPPGWSVTGTGITIDTVFPNIGSYDVAFTAATTDAHPGILSQTIATVAGQSYVLRFAALDEAGFSGDRLKISFGGFSATVPGNAIAAPGTLASFYTAESFTIPGAFITAGSSTLTFQGFNDPSFGIALNLDDVSLQAVAVPEPAAGLLLGAGLVWSALMSQARYGRRVRSNTTSRSA